MSFKKFLGELKKGLKSPAYLLYSNDLSLLKEAMFSIKNTIPEHERDFAFDVFDAASPEKSIKEAIANIYTVPFFKVRKVLVIEAVERFKEQEFSALSQYILKPCPDAVLIMLYATEKGKFKKPTHKEALSSAVSIALNISEAELLLWVRERAAAMGFNISSDAVEYLIGVMGPDIGLLSSELKKFSQMGQKTINRNDIVQIIKGSGDYNVFDLVDALSKKDIQGVFKIYNSLSDTIDPQNLIGAINWHYTKMSGRDPVYLKRVFKILSETDISLKSLGGSYPLEYTLLRLLKA